MRKKHNDSKNAQSILESAEKQMKYTLTLISTEESAFNIVRNIYECFRMIGDALLISKGKISEYHTEQIRILADMKVRTERPIKLVDNLRRMRHNINYYGYSPRKIEAEDAINLAKSCFYQLLSKAKEEIKNKNGPGGS